MFEHRFFFHFLSFYHSHRYFRVTAFLFLKRNICFLPGLKSTLTRSFFLLFFQFNLSPESFIQQLIALSFIWMVIQPAVSIRLILMV